MIRKLLFTVLVLNILVGTGIVYEKYYKAKYFVVPALTVDYMPVYALVKAKEKAKGNVCLRSTIRKNVLTWESGAFANAWISFPVDSIIKTIKDDCGIKVEDLQFWKDKITVVWGKKK